MYYTRIRVIGDNEIANKISNFLSSLGYELTSDKPNLYIIVGELEKAFKYVNKKGGIIFVSSDGEYVIPLKKESKGVSFVASIISDLLNSTLVLTSKFSQLSLYSVEEFSWINVLFSRDKEKLKEINKKLLEKRRVYVYSDGLNIQFPEGYIKVENPCESDIIVGESNCEGKLLLKPAKVIVGLYFIERIPAEVLLYSIKLTMKSLFLNENRVDVILTPVNDSNIRNISKIFGAEYHVIHADTCEGMLYNYGGKILLRQVKRAYGVITCLSALFL